MSEARLTISRVIGGKEDRIDVEIGDEDSKAVIRVAMTLADFAKLVTGHGHMRGEIVSAHNVQHWGKKREHKVVSVPNDYKNGS